jgi:hypothetical protein
MTPLLRSTPPARRRSRRLLVLAAFGASALTACADRTNARASTLDSALSRDLTLAESATPDVAIGDTAVRAVAPQEVPIEVPIKVPEISAINESPKRQNKAIKPDLSPKSTQAPNTAPAPAPLQAPAPSPAPTSDPTPAPATAPRARALGPGTVLEGTTNAAICSLAQRPGDRFVVTLGREVTGPDGGSLPAGTPVLVELARVDTAAGDFAFRLRGVQVQGEFIPADGTVRIADAAVTGRKVSKGGSDQGKVLTGAIIGGILGRVMGGGARGAIIGAAGGAAAGTVAAARNTTTERCMAAGATLTATLNVPLTLPPSP